MASKTLPPRGKKARCPLVVTDSDDEFINAEVKEATPEEPATLEKMRTRVRNLRRVRKLYTDKRGEGEEEDEDEAEVVAVADSTTDKKKMPPPPSLQKEHGETPAKKRRAAAATAMDVDEGQIENEDTAAATDADEIEEEEESDDGDETVVYAKPAQEKAGHRPLCIQLDETWAVKAYDMECTNKSGSFPCIGIVRKPKSKSGKAYTHSFPRRLLDEHITALKDIIRKSHETKKNMMKIEDVAWAHKDALKDCWTREEEFQESFW